MWTAQLDESRTWYWLNGPIAQIGRSPDVGLQITVDKSISRVHAELIINGNSNILKVKDLGSKFGTRINGAVIASNNTVEIAADVDTPIILTVGGSGYKVTIVRRKWKLCYTKLDRKQKDRVKECARLLGAEIVSSPNNCSYLICSSLGATVKVLHAICANIPIVALEFLSFASADSPSVVPIPPAAHHKPAGDLDVVSFEESRHQLFSQLLVVLQDQNDEQYEAILQHCGATIVRIWQVLDQPWMQVLASIAQRYAEMRLSSQGAVTIALFFDENQGSEPDNQIQVQLEKVCKYSVHWLTAASVAKAVFTKSSPELFSSPPRPRSTQCGAESQYLSQLRATSSQTFDAFSFLPSPVSLAKSSVAHRERTAAASNHTALTLVSKSGSTKRIEDIDQNNVDSSDNHELPIMPPKKRARQSKVIDLFDDMPPPSAVSTVRTPVATVPSGAGAFGSSGSGLRITAVMNTGSSSTKRPRDKADDVVALWDSEPFPSSKKLFAPQRGATPTDTSENIDEFKEDPANYIESIVQGTSSKLSPVTLQPKSLVPEPDSAALPDTVHEGVDADEWTAAKRSQAPIETIDSARPVEMEACAPHQKLLFEEVPAAVNPSRPQPSRHEQLRRYIVDNESEVAEDWLEVDHSFPRMCIVDSTAGEGQLGRLPTPPISEERSMIVLPVERPPSALMDNSSEKPVSGRKRFVKNRVVSAGNQAIDLSLAPRVLPRESEREVQMRLEWEAQRKEEERVRSLMDSNPKPAATSSRARLPRR